MKREELLRSKEYWMVQIQNDLYGMVEEFRKKNDLKQKDLAELLKVSKGYISQILNGDFDHKISKLVDLSLAFNKAPIVTYQDLDEFINQNIVDYSYGTPATAVNDSQPLTLQVSDDLKQPIYSEDTNSGGAVVIEFNNPTFRNHQQLEHNIAS